MEFVKTMNQFLAERKEGKFYDSSITTYRRKLEVFFEFLYAQCNINDNIYADLLRGMSNETVVKAIEYYVNEYDIKFKVTVDNYFTVIKAYFDFISEKYNIKNENFDSTKKFTMLKALVDKRVKEMKLNLSEQKPPIVKTVFDNLNQYCNQRIDSLDKITLIKKQLEDEDSYNRPLVQFISAIIIKLVMCTGIKNQVLGGLVLNDLDIELNKIKINGYWIHLPDKLGTQFKKYIEVRKDIAKDNSKKGPLFVNKKGESLDTDYKFMFAAMENIVGNRKAESIAKFTIINMILKGINSSIIQEFTSFGLDTYLHCQELVNEEKAKEDFKSKNRYLDSKIRDLEIFDEL